jgi:hypothetical protein
LPQIVTVNAQLSLAPAPSTLQATGAFVSQGGTNLGAGQYALLTSASSLTTYYLGALAISSLTWSSSLVTATAVNPHGYTVGDTLYVVIAGAVPAAYNGTFLVTVTTSTAFTYVLLSNPGSETTPGTYQTRSGIELQEMNTTYWGQGSVTPVYVLELGPGNATDGATALGTFITANSQPQFFYSYLVPRYWDANPTFLSLIADYESPSSKTYFFVTTTLQTYTAYTDLMKSVLWLIQAPNLGVWPSNVVTALLSSPVAPTLSSSASGSLAAATYYVRVTYTTAQGETVASPEADLAVAANHVLVVDTPTTVTGAVTWSVYASTTSGTETLQASGLTIGSNWTQPTSGLIVGVAYPTQGYAIATTTSAHNVSVGQWFQLVGFTPTGWNNWYQAQAGTTGSTLVLYVLSYLAPVTVDGSLAAGTATQTAAPGGLTGEFTLAAPFYASLSYAPSAGNLMTPFAFKYLFGVTPWVSQGNGNVLTAIKNASGNYVLADLEGGITDTSLYWGTTADGNDFSFWFEADFLQIGIELTLANLVINGSNNSQNPLSYNQLGINQIQASAAGFVGNCIAFNVLNGSLATAQLTATAFAAAIDNENYVDQDVVNCVPFIPYVQANPGDYQKRIYKGIQILAIPQNGFIQLVVNLTLSQLPGFA